MNHKKLVVLLCLAASSAMASSIVLYDTGVSNTNSSLATPDTPGDNVFDPHFTTNTGTQAYTFFTPGYLTETSTTPADWISTATCGQPNSVGGCNVTPTFATNPGIYNYTESFTLPSAGSVTISGEWASDDCAEIILNPAGPSIDTGQGIGGGITSASCNVASGNFTGLHPFSFTANLSGGPNYIDFEVYNAFLSTALLVTDLNGTFTPASATPEPASLGLTAAGLALLAIGRVRKRRRP